jgi:hypothetical protein
MIRHSLRLINAAYKRCRRSPPEGLVELWFYCVTIVSRVIRDALTTNFRCLHRAFSLFFFFSFWTLFGMFTQDVEISKRLELATFTSFTLHTSQQVLLKFSGTSLMAI